MEIICKATSESRLIGRLSLGFGFGEMKLMKSQNIYSIQHLSPAKMLIKLAWPVVLSMLVQGVYGVVDSLYLSRLGETVMSAMSLCFVVQNLANFFFTGVATGLNAVISRALGEDNKEKAKNAVVSGCVVQLCIVFVFTLFGFFGVPKYFLFSSALGDVSKAGIFYLRPVMIFSAVTAAQVTFERLLQTSGMTKHMLYCQMAGFLINMILDPIFIFTLKLGCSGAAYATVIGQLAAAGLAIYFNLKRNHILFEDISAKKRFRWNQAAQVAYIGIPSAAVGIASCICTYCINRILIGFSPTSNAAFGIYAKIESFAIIPGQGISAAMVTLLAFFYGRKRFDKIRAVIKAGTVMAASWFWACGTIFILFPHVILSIFKATEQMYTVGIPAFRIVGSTFYLSGFMISLGAFYQAIGKSVYSLIIALSRQILVRIPAAYLLSGLNSEALIWWSWPISEIVSDSVSVLFFLYSYRRVKNELQSSAADLRINNFKGV